MLLNLGSFSAMVEHVSRDVALIFLSGILLFVAGLAIVRVHNRWASGWPVVVTVIGWLALLGGLARMLFPVQLSKVALALAQRTGVVAALAIVLVVVITRRLLACGAFRPAAGGCLFSLRGVVQA